MKRECYTLVGFQGQTKKALRVLGNRASKLERIFATSTRDFREGVRNPGWLVPFAAKRNRSEIGGVGLDEQAILRHQAKQRVVRPFLECHYSAERHIPSGAERDFGEIVRARVAVQHAGDSSPSGILNDRSRVAFCLSRVYDDRFADLGGESDLCRECRALRFARRVVVVVIETAFADCHKRISDKLAQLRDIAGRVKAGGVVRVNSGGGEDETRILPRAPSRYRCSS